MLLFLIVVIAIVIARILFEIVMQFYWEKLMEIVFKNKFKYNISSTIINIEKCDTEVGGDHP